MEENSEAHMDSAVSSTSEVTPGPREAASSRPNVETVVVVEEIKEEEVSPNKQRRIEEKKADLPSENALAKTTPTVIQSSPKEPPIKKIIIKASNKDYQIVKIVQKSPNKQDDTSKVTSKESPNKPTQVISQLNSSDKSPAKGDKTMSQKTPEKENIVQKFVIKSPSKESDTQKPAYDSSGKVSLAKEPIKIIIAKETPSKTATILQQTSKSTSTKEQQANVSTTSSKEIPTSSLTIEPQTKTSVPKAPPTQDLSGKKQEQTNVVTLKETTEEPTLTKDPLPQGDTKEFKEQTSKSSGTPQPIFEKDRKESSDSKTPDSSDNTKPESSDSKKPESSDSKEPENSERKKPEKSESKNPEKSDSKKPENSDSKKPENSDSKKPENSDSKQPENSDNKKPENSDNKKPENSDGKKPGPTMTNNVSSMDIDIEASNDSQTETNSDISEKDHNKSISRELRSLINSAKESKIISECTQLTSKTRKSRPPLDISSTSLNSSQCERLSLNADSDNSQKSGSSEKSEKVLKRSMRSQNPEFVHKVKQFLNSVTGKTQKGEGEASDDEADESKTKEKEPVASTPKKKKIEDSVPEKTSKLRVDPYCWRCHWAIEPANEKAHPPINCTVCPRAFHFKCLTGPERSKINPEKNCVCPECLMILHAESSDTRSPAMKKISLGMLCELLKHALERMMEVNGVEPFMNPVDRTTFPHYDKYVVHPMDLSKMKQQIIDGQYGSTEAFLADAQWILHNSIIFNTLQSKLTAGARSLVRSCRAEMGEIEACPECYAGAHARRSTWFTDVCSTPHILLWAKLKGFPYWPAKGMTVNSSGLVDVRFFGAHDRAWVPARDCFLYSEKDPNNFRTKRQDILDSMQEAEQHIRNISRKYGKFVYPPFKTQFDPTKLNEQLKMMIPMFEGEVKNLPKEKAHSNSPPSAVKEKRRSASKSSKGSVQEFDISDLEDNSESQKVEETMDIDKQIDKPSAEKEKGKKKEKDEKKATEKKEKDEKKNTEKKEKDDKKNTEKKEKDEKKGSETEKEKEKPMEVDDPKTKEIKEKEADSSRKRRRSELVEAVITICDVGSTREKRRRVTSDLKTDTVGNEVSDVASTSKDTAQTLKEPEKQKGDETLKRKASEATADTTDEKSTTKSPGKLIAITRVVKTAKTTPKESPVKEVIEKSQAKTKGKPEQMNSSQKTPTTQEEKSKVQKRRYSNKSNKSLNTSNAGKSDKDTDKKNEKSSDGSKEKQKENSTNNSESNKVSSNTNTPEKSNTTSKVTSNSSTKVTSGSSTIVSSNSNTKVTTSSSTTTSSSIKDRLQFDDDTSLAVIARETAKTNVIVSNSLPRLPTITSVRSLNSETTVTKTTSPQKSIEITIEAPSDSNIFTPTSTDNVRNMQDAVNKLQKLRNESDPPPLVGRVGVRAFARMTSPSVEEARKNSQKNNEVQVEIKTEPIDLDDADRQIEKMDLMNAFKLRPVNGPSSLREVRINKVVVTSGGSNNSNNSNNKKAPPPKQVEVRPRAKKTFPQPKKPDDGRSELNSKNSMVYIPIQPPMTQAPVRPQRPGNANGPVNAPPGPRPLVPIVTSAPNSTVNTATTQIVPVSISSLTSSTPTSAPSTISGTSPIQAVPTVGQVPTTVHTVPLITSVNGQWTFSLQPMMSVGGGLDNSPPPSMMNGLPERPGNVPQLMPAGSATPALPPAPPSLVATTPVSSANRTADSSAPGEPPRLMQRPNLMNPLDVNTPVGSVPPPSTAGPLTAKLNQNAVKMADFFRTLLEDSIEKLDEPVAQLTAIKLQLEQSSWRHQQQIDEIKHNHELTLAEMRSSFEKEKIRLVSETRRAAQVELEAAVKLAKSKQWCANCSQEAQFYCCWNTSYCDYPCQRAHWAQHYAVCTQQRAQDGSGNDDSSSEKRLQHPPENLPRTTAAPNLTVGGKLAPSRVYTQQDNSNKSSSIIMSMVEDSSGNQSLKCVGTYKPPNANQISPLIINKQIMNSEEAAKKVVTSGGYLIVGAANPGGSNNPPAIVTQARRTHTIQYYT